jgi:hypothetical protein
MASITTLTAGTTTPYATLLNINEAGTAAAAETVDILALLASFYVGTPNPSAAQIAAMQDTYPLYEGLSAAFADQAAARAYLFANIDLIDYFIASSVGTSATVFDANVSAPATARNFRLVVTAVKAQATDTYIVKSRFALRHSIVR